MEEPMETVEISSGVHWVGVKDWDRRMFDRLIPLPNGTSYNAYLVQGNEKTALIDTVNPGFEEDLEKKVRRVTEPEDIDYVVMNHAEPDHASAIPHMLSLAEEARVLTTEKGKELAQSLHHISEDKIQTVADKETVDLGGKTLRFVRAPWLHWPETMLTFYEEEGILFPCDFFGCHLASSKFYAQEFGDEIIRYAKGYYGEIMMPFSKMVGQALDRLEDLEIDVIAPSHGPVYKNPERIMGSYRDWAEGKVKKKVLLVYLSMWGSTEKMAETAFNTIASEEVEIESLNIASTDLGKLAEEIVDSAGIIVGTPTIHGGAHPKVHHIVHLLRKLNPPTKLLGIIESHGWRGAAVSEILEMVKNLDAEIVGSVEVEGSPSEDEIEEVVEFGKNFADQVRNLG